MSILDVPKLEISSMEEATNFIQAYGFDPNNAADVDRIWQAFDEAVQFIEKALNDPQRARVPEHLRDRKAVTDIRRLLLLASQSDVHPDQVWACAILRLMHVLIHLAHDPRLKYFEQAQNQILSRLDQYLYIDEADGATYLGNKAEGQGIKLLFFKKKDRKDRDREIIKLLHKAEALVEEIYDRLGFRLVTETKFDAVRAVRLLLAKNIISLPNVRPGRSRNRLIDLKRLEAEASRLESAVSSQGGKKEGMDSSRLFRRLERRIGVRRIGRSIMNPHSSEYYRAIQFTCRELVRVHSPQYQVYARLKAHLEEVPGGLQVMGEVFPSVPGPYDYVFFPYEIQIMDVKSYADSIFGKSNHEEYRRKQLEAARARVFAVGL
ncbi:MAG: TIGR04552 family protein [Deltaproteobacteria bacterium]|nr:TIGR04552 family protein [Deltaproteobacteria bacterium]